MLVGLYHLTDLVDILADGLVGMGGGHDAEPAALAPTQHPHRVKIGPAVVDAGGQHQGGQAVGGTGDGARLDHNPALFAGLVDEMVQIETDATHNYFQVLEELGRPVPDIDLRLEHILITGMFRTFFELIIHAMPLNEAENYLREMRAFYTAGWMKIMGQ